MEEFQLLGATITAPTTTGTATTVSGATYVMVFNSAAAGTNHAVAYLTEASGTVLGNVTVAGQERIILKKERTEVFYAANAAIMLTPINPSLR
tara:strand:- start:242 stop:520 length:279 start_codon:yes stop_codon:yes gene_type:complete